jgi:hypothetical protein
LLTIVMGVTGEAAAGARAIATGDLTWNLDIWSRSLPLSCSREISISIW